MTVGDAHAVVTGAGCGIGAAIATALAAAGMRVTLMGRRLQVLQETAAALNRAHCLAVDVTEPSQVSSAFAAARADCGPVQVLVNNAGTAVSGAYLKLDEQDWHHCLEVNLFAAHLCVKATLPDMLAAGQGRVINIASTAALRGYSYVAPYVASKHALLGLTRALAVEFATSGITFNAVCPGYTETDMLSRSIENIVEKTGRSREEAVAELVRFNPQGRFIQPQEVARTVVWLCSEDARSINGQAISVSGGETF